MNDFRDLPLTRGIEQSMRHLSARQRVIAENVANASTPGYRTRDVAAPDFGATLRATGRAASASGIARPTVPMIDRPRIGATPEDSGRVVVAGRPDEVTTDGNDVDIESQMLRMSDTQSQYATVANLYRKSRQMMRIATGGR